MNDDLPDWYANLIAAACGIDPLTAHEVGPDGLRTVFGPAPGDDADAADRLADATGRDRDVFAADDLPLPTLDDLEPAPLPDDAITRATERIAAREERELRGAWRAGYDRVDVYDEQPEFGSGVGRVTLTRRYIPRHAGDDRRDPSGWRYAFSYDLENVPDDVLLAAIRGEL